MLFSFDAIESLPLFKKLPFTSMQKRILGILLISTTSIWVFGLTLLILFRLNPAQETTDLAHESTIEDSVIVYNYSDVEISAFLRQGETLITQKRYNEAGELLEKLSYIEEPSREQLLLTTKLLQVHNKPLDARKSLTRIMNKYGNDEEIAVEYLKTFPENELLPPKWESITPNYVESPKVLYTVAEKIKQNHPQEAISLLKNALTWERKSAKSHYLLAVLYRRIEGTTSLATAHFHAKRSVELASDSGNYHAEYANILHTLYEQSPAGNTKLYNQAEKEYKKAIDLLPTNSTVLYNLGELYSLKKKRHREAESCYLQALELSSDFWQASFKLGILYLENEKYTGATKHLHNALKHNALNIRILHQLAVSYEKNGNKDQAQSTYKQILTINPKDDIALYKLKFNN